MKQNKYFKLVLRIICLLWLLLVVFHVSLVGQIALCNFTGSIPTFIFLVLPSLWLSFEFFQKECKIWWISGAVIALLLGTTQVDLNLLSQKNPILPTSTSRELKIFNWNTNCWDQHKNKDQFYQFLKKQQADIYILQEYLYGSLDWSDPRNQISAAEIKRRKLFRICSVVPGFPVHYQWIDDTKRLRAEFPGYYLATNQQFVMISRFPIVAAHADYSEQYAVTDLKIDGRIVRFFNVHLLLHIEPENPLQSYFYEALQRRFVARKLALNNLKADLKKTEYGYLIAGDFNSTKAMGLMSELLHEHQDAINYSRQLLPLTFQFAGLKLWRFDYFLLRKEKKLQVKTYRNLDHHGLSDHDPQLVQLWLE